MILVLINILIICVVGAIAFWLIEKYARDRRLANLLKLLVITRLSRRHPATSAAGTWRWLLGRAQAATKMSDSDYHPFVPAPGHSAIAGPTPRAHAQARMQNPRAQGLFATWAELAAAPFKGMTTDGHVQPALFALGPEDAPTAAMVEAAKGVARRSCRQRNAAPHAIRSTPSCGGIGKTPSFMSSITGFGSMRLPRRSRKPFSRCSAPA